MITRYQVNFEDRIIEPHSHGKWVKYEDHQTTVSGLEAEMPARLEAMAGNIRQELQEATGMVATLTESLRTAETELEQVRRTNNATIERQTFLLKSAKDRLKLLGHAPNCDSRYGQITVGGSETVGKCNCGLEEWFRGFDA